MGMNILWHIRVSFEKEGYEEYPCFSFYDIEAPDYSVAELKARKQFCASFGFKMQDTKAYTFDKHMTRYRAELAAKSSHKPAQ